MDLNDALNLKVTPRDCVTAVLLSPDGRLWLAYKRSGYFATAGGRCEANQTLGENLYREVEEETGISRQFIEVEEYWGTVPGRDGDDILHNFLCRTRECPRLTEPDVFDAAHGWKLYGPVPMPANYINLRQKVLIEQRLRNTKSRLP